MQAPVRTNDLLNAVRHVDMCSEAGSLAGQASPPIELSMISIIRKEGTTASVLVGEEYYAAKQTLISQEQVLLRLMHFNLVVDHPQRYLLNYAHTLQCRPEMLQLAMCLLNDSLRTTALSTTCSGPELAGAALHLSSLLLGQARDLPFQASHSWWNALDLQLDRIEEIGAGLLAMFRTGNA